MLCQKGNEYAKELEQLVRIAAHDGSNDGKRQIALLLIFSTIILDVTLEL